ncbi:MAG: PAS domain S-box protein [Bacteroidales bacterium]|nr:PAS domain S-box protein [Bacteroidales bacterium]
MNIFSWLSLLSAGFALALGLIVYFRSSRGWLAYTFLLLSASLAVLNLSQFNLRTASNLLEAILWSKVYGIWTLVLSFSVHFTYELIRKKSKSLLFYSLFYLPGFLFFYLHFATDLISLNPVKLSWGWNVQFKYEFAHNLAAFVGIIFWLLSISFTYIHFKNTEGNKKKAARLIFIGFLFSFIVTIITDFLFPIYKIIFPELGAAANIITISIIGFAIWKYKIFLLDADSLTLKLFQEASNYIILIDNQRQILESNENFKTSLGYTENELIGKKLDDFLVKVSAEGQNPLTNFIQKNAEFRNQELVFRSKSNKLVPINFSATYFQQQGKSKPGFLYTGENTSQTKRIDSGILDYQRQIDFLAEAALDLVKFKTKEEVYQFISKKIYCLLDQKVIVTCVEFKGTSSKNSWEMKSISGISNTVKQLGELTGFDVNKLSSNTDEKFAAQLVKNKLVSVDFNVANLTNNLISNKVGNAVKSFLGVKDLYSIFIQHGNLVYGTISILTKKNTPQINKELIESFLAITAQVMHKLNAEQELIKNNNLFQTIVNNSQIAMFILDLEGKFIFTAGRKLHRLKINSEENIGKSIFELYADLPYMLDQVRKALKGETFREIISLKGILYFQVYFGPFQDEYGNTKGIVCMADDISSRIRSEKKLENLTEMQAQLFRVIGHDLKSPTANILSYTDLLLSDFESFSKTDIKQFTTSIQSSAHNAYQILENILQWTKSVNKETAVKKEPISLHTKILTAIEQILPLAEKKSIKIYNYVDKSPKTIADKNMIITILRNLLSNAIKFTNNGGSITLKAHQDKNHIYLEIIDTGIGMNDEQVEKLFDFNVKKVSRGTSGEIGSGLGLQISKDFMGKNGGTIEVKSKLNEGSVFTLVFPLAEIEKQKAIPVNLN